MTAPPTRPTRRTAARPTPRTGAGVIAIDGPSGTGKSTVARTVATRIGAGYLDTGALYRMVALHVLQSGIDPTDDDAVAASLPGLDLRASTDPADQHHELGGVDVTTRIRLPDVTAAVTPVSANPAVRAFLLERQRTIAHTGLMVVEGRDIGTVIAPDAAAKVFLTADAHVRAERRYRQNGADGGATSSVASVFADLRRRDTSDAARATAPLRAADDAVLIDSTHLTLDETVDAVLAVVRARGFVDKTAPVARPVRWFHLGGEHDPVPEGRRPRDVDRGRRIGIALSHLLYRMTIRGEQNMPPSGPLVVVANHTTFMDGPILFGRLPRRISFLIKAEVLRGPLGWLLRTVGQYAISRTAPQREVLLAALAQLKAGGVIGIFPEGQRTDGSVSDVFNGAGWLAVRAGATVIPVALRGTARPAGRRWRRFRPPVHAVVGEAFDIAPGAGRTAVNAATALVRQRLAALVADLDRDLAAVEALRARRRAEGRRA